MITSSWSRSAGNRMRSLISSSVSGEDGTRGGIFPKRRLLGECILAVRKAGIWRMSVKACARKLINNHGVRQQRNAHEPTEQPKALDWSGICCRHCRLGQRLRTARAARQVELRAGRDHRAVFGDPRAVISAETVGGAGAHGGS